MGIESVEILAQRYKIENRLGRGGNAYVYLAFDLENKQKRAIKKIDKRQGAQSYELARREAEIIWKLKYPYFPQIFDIVEEEEADYIVMEYLEGETAGERLRRLGALPAQEVARMAKDLCLMLSYLHHYTPPLVYCDLKPDNIMVQSAGNLRLIDFGAVAKAGEADKLCVRLGTKGYAAPEQFDMSRRLDARTDIYALGATMYQLLTGNEPGKSSLRGKFFCCRPRRLATHKLERMIRKCMRENPGERYQDCEELREDLNRVFCDK